MGSDALRGYIKDYHKKYIKKRLSHGISGTVVDGTERWGLTSLRMLCARRKGFASKSLVPPSTEHPTSRGQFIPVSRKYKEDVKAILLAT